jgi:hypothetical protein
MEALMRFRGSVWPIWLALTGCSSGYPIPTAHVIDARNAIATAQGAGAAGQPGANVHLKLAQDELSKARGELERGNNRNADMLLVRAKSDADLARSLAEGASAKREAQEVIDRIKAVAATQP